MKKKSEEEGWKNEKLYTTQAVQGKTDYYSVNSLDTVYDYDILKRKWISGWTVTMAIFLFLMAAEFL